jgi:hypothetical protein
VGSEVQVLPDPPKEKTWGHSSVGRAPALQAGGHRFDPVCLHHTLEIKLSLKKLNLICEVTHRSLTNWKAEINKQSLKHRKRKQKTAEVESASRIG